MASKSKRRAQQQARKQESAAPAVMVAMLMAILAIFQNRYGQFSDIRGFYGLHFADGLHHWPFSTHTLTGATEPMHPVEYPALTGLIMWFFSFFIAPAQLGWLHYYWLTASFHVVLFGGTAFAIKQLAGRKYAMVFAVSPAVLYSLNRNWDIWAILPMIIAIILYEKGKKRSSAIFLAISIATKFFPLVLLFPLAISGLRQKQFGAFIRYLIETVLAWVLINLPFAIYNFAGWAYFYQFNFKRGLGSASVWDVSGQLHLHLPNNNVTYYILNLGIFALLGLFLFKTAKVLTLSETAFLTMFAFILFNKQYSMQYVIWLAALAVITMKRLNAKNQMVMLYIYIVWQITELVFQYSFFQNILTSSYANTSTPASPAISGTMYGVAGLIRYIAAIAFAAAIAHYLHREKRAEVLATKS